MVCLERPFLTQRALDLSRVVNRVVIEAANEEVLKGHNYRGARCEAMDCTIATPAQKALVGKHAAEHGVMNSIRRKLLITMQPSLA